MTAPAHRGSDPYVAFLTSKIRAAGADGFDIAPEQLNPHLKPMTRDLVRWAAHGGRRAIFAAFGLHKTATQLELMRVIGAHGPVPDALRLIVLPLGVRQEFVREAATRFPDEYALRLKFIRTADEIEDARTIYLTNYESVRDGKLDPNLFHAASLDEASVLRSYGSKTYQTFLTLFDQVRYRFVATATPSPNRYKELIHYAGFLGVMDTGQALTRFFQRDSEHANHLTLYPHMETEFFAWLHSWAVFIQSPSDLCRCSCHGHAQHSRGSDSAGSPSSAGSLAPSATARGAVGATAATSASSDPATCAAATSSRAAALDRSATAGRERDSTASGAECVTDASGAPIRTGETTAAEVSASASAGEASPASPPTWDSRRQGPPSTESTTTGTTNRATAGGPIAGSRLVIAAHGGRRRSCDGCRCDEGYALPPLQVHYHEVPAASAVGRFERDGQGQLVADAALSLPAAAAEKRDSIPARVAALCAILDRIDAAEPGAHVLLWHHLEAERHAIQRVVPEAVSVWGSQDLDRREQAILDFSDGNIQYLSTKPEIAGSGCNFQRHCHHAVFLGIDYQFNDFIQAIHRIHRFQQTHPVEIHIITTAAEREVLKALQAKWAEDVALRERMQAIIREHGLASTGLAGELARTIGCPRRQVTGAGFEVVNADSVEEYRRIEANRFGMLLTSIPFGNHYEYSASYNDFGHNEDHARFFAQMDFLTPELLRVLQPGRVLAVHVKDRIRFGNVTGDGFPTVEPFHADCIHHYRRHGFRYLGMITVVTDVVRENNQTYRLGWTEQCKDGSKMGVGSPEYILLFRKLPSDTSKGYADVRVAKAKTDYSRARWQVDAHAFWRSSGNRLVTPEELAKAGPDTLGKLFRAYSRETVYDYAEHVALGEALEARGALPATFMAIAPGSHHPDVWDDVVRMRTLNGQQTQRGLTHHICPLQFDIVDRLIARYTNPGDEVSDPFMGLGTVPLRALRLGRRGHGVELSAAYFEDATRYLVEVARKAETVDLFALLDAEANAEPAGEPQDGAA